MEFFGDSDCDENPFAPTDEIKDLHRHSSVDTIGKLSLEDGQEQEHSSLSSLRENSAGATSSTTDAAALGEAGTSSGAGQGHSNRNSYRLGELSKSTATGHPSTAFPRGLRWQAFPSSVPTAFESHPAFIPAYSATAGRNVEGNNPVADRLAALPVIDSIGSEVETETEGETETEDGVESGSDEEEGHRDVVHRRSSINNMGSSRNNAYNGSGCNTTSGSSPTTAGEEEHIALIDAELNNAQAGQPDPHAMRLLLRKMGYVPPSRRKDIWRLLILGRVEATGVQPSVGAGGGTRYSYAYPSDMIALEAAILSTDLDLDNQRVVRVDVERTRPALEQFKRPRVKNLLTRVLTHHCKANGLGYKQGMHEVLAPFVALSDPELPTSDISLCYAAFIKRFLPYAFNKDEEFLSLQICFRLFRILLLYHHPRLCRFLDQYQLQPELYATPWFLTLFSNSLDLQRLYEVWDFYLFWGDPALHHFVVLSFIIGNADVILQAEEANLPETMCRLTVGMRSVEELRALTLKAKDLMLNTPKSFRKILRSALYANLSQGQMNLVLNTLQVSSCIPVSAEEVISYILHKNPHRQLDQESDDEDSLADDFHNNKSRSSTVGNSPDAGEHRSVRSPPRAITGGGGSADDDENLPWRGGGGAVGGGDKALPTPKRSAERAAMRSLRVHRQYIIVDCRPKAEFEACRLAPALHLDPELLVSPDDLDAKLKEYIPLQGMAHFCLVGAGGVASTSGGGASSSRAAPSDLSGEAMGLRTSSITDRSKAEGSGGPTAAGGGGDWSVDAGGSSVKADGGGVLGGPGSRDKEKDGGFGWMGNLSRALARAQGDDVDKEEGEVGREEDVQVARFVLMLLQYNFPYISHVRGDMGACLQELSAQALHEKDEQLSASGESHDALLAGVLIGTDADRVREELTHCSPEKKTEGMFAGFPKWSKGAAGATEGEARERSASWTSRGKARDKSDSSVNSRDASAPRGRGGMGRRGTEDFADHGLKCADEERKSGKRRLFGSVLDRFDKADKDGGRGGGDATNSASTEQLSPPPKEGSRLPTEGRTWLTPGRGVVANGSLRDPDVSVSNAAEQSGASTAPGDDEGANAVRRGSGTWVKGSRSNNPERFTRFITKFIGVRDDAIPDDGAGSSAGGDRTRTESLDEPGRRQAARVNVVSDAAGDAASNAVTTDETSVNGGAGGRSIGGDGVRAESVPSASIPAETNVSSGGGAAVSSSGDRYSEEGATGITTPAEASAPVTATAVYDPSTVPFVTTDALPVAVAVAVPIEADSTTVASPECPPDRPLTRSVRPRRPGTTTTTTTTRTAAMAATGGGTMAGETAGRRTERGAPTVPSKVPVSISEWVAKEQRESGGVVRMFTAQRVVDGKVQKKCRLAVSPKNMTQFDDIEEGTRATGGAKGVISEHRGLRHLSRITSRKKHADLIVFHFKSRSGSTSTAAASSSRTMEQSESSRLGASGGGGSSNSRKSRKSSSDRDSAANQPDVLFYFMKEHSECLKMVKENYRKVTAGGGGGGTGASNGGDSGGGGGGSSSSRSTSAADVTPAASAARRNTGQARSSPRAVDESSSGKLNRGAGRAVAGAAAGAAGLMVGAAAGVAVGAAAGVAVGAAYLAGQRRASQDDEDQQHHRSSSSPPLQRERRRRSGEGSGGNRSSRGDLGRSGGWVPIGEAGAAAAAAGGEIRAHGSKGEARASGRRPSTARATATRRSSELYRGARATSGSGSKVPSAKSRKAEGGPTWLG